MTQYNLGYALHDLGTRSAGDESRLLLQEAVVAYQSSLEVRLKEQGPRDWAATQNNLGSALQNLAARSGGEEARELLQAAVDAYRSALEVRTQEHLPRQWATTQNNLASALQALAQTGDVSSARAELEEAAGLLASLADASENGLLEKSWAPGFLGTISFLKLKLNKPADAVAAAQKALQLDPQASWIKLNLLTGYLLENDWSKAEHLLAENAAVVLNDKPFWQQMLEDLDVLEKYGVKNPNVERMRQLIVNRYSKAKTSAPAAPPG
jgi:tetratricopeptide (TPR) repeat protein